MVTPHPKDARVLLPGVRSLSRMRSLAALALLAALAACQKNPLVVQRSICPAVAVPIYAGDVTLFRGDGRDAADQDAVATMTNVREHCTEGGETITVDITYDIVARRTSADGARALALPVFASVVQGGNLIVSKQIGDVALNFGAGQYRATARGGARASVSRAAATLRPDVQAKIDRKRKPGDLDAAIDPLSDPSIKQAIKASTFEILVGFQLTDAQLAYNVTK